MTNRKSTKRALLGSVMAMVLCLAMLVGATFAWFTDTASTGVNKIQAGKLDIALEMKDASGSWVSAEGKTMDFVKAADAENEAILWEPGCIYTLPELRVVNNGNLALKYMIKITGIKGDAKLNEAIEWTIGDVAMGAEQHLAAGESNTFTIKGHMKESAGNDYMDLTISGISITVYATQNTVESDSFNNQYDKNAAYKGTQEFTEGTRTLSNGVVALNPNDIAVKASGRDTNVTITGGYYDGGNGGNNICVYAMDGATVTIQGGTFTVGSDASGEGNSVVESNGGNIVIDTINGMPVRISGQHPSLIVQHRDRPGVIAEVTDLLADRGVNICNFSLSRRQKGGVAVMTIEMDGGLDEALAARVRALPDVMLCVTLLP